jgi:hypothetical protein
VNALNRDGQEGLLESCEVFLYTDNHTAEGSYFRGSAKSWALFELIVILYKLQMQHDFILHVVWIAGTRMIQQGTDGLSRGDEKGPATSGVALSGMVLLHLGACERIPLLLNWLEDWCDLGKDFKVLEPEGWFTQAHKLGYFGWFPMPATDNATIDQLCEAVYKRPFCFHVFAVLLLMTNRWRKQLLKATDMIFFLKPGSKIWFFSQHEPLGIFISLPLGRHEPWRLRKTKPVVDPANCERCKTLITYRKGIFCGNFSASRGNWTPCQKAWCLPCFKPLEGESFPTSW